VSMPTRATSRRREEIEASPTAVRPRARKGKAGGQGGVAAGRKKSSREGHAHELTGLAFFGLAVFLGFVLVAGDVGGVVGRGVSGALTFLLGRFAFLVPLLLIGAAAVLVFDRKIEWRSGWLWGGAVLLGGLMLLTTAGFPPFGPSHAPEMFMSEVFRARAGAVGEAGFAALSALLGQVGVTVVGWLLIVAAVVLITGKTMRQMAADTQKAARTVGNAAERTTVRIRRRLEPDEGPLDDPYVTGFGPKDTGVRRQAPDTASGRSTASSQSTAEAEGAERMPFGTGVAQATFADTGVRWAGEAGGEVDGFVPRVAVRPRFHDGAEVFPDLFGQGAVQGQPLHTQLGHAEGAAAGTEASSGEQPHGAGEGALSRGRAVDAGAAPGEEAAAGGLAREDALAHEDAAHPGAATAILTEEGAPSAPSQPVWHIPAAALLRKSTSRVDPGAKTDAEVSRVLVDTLESFGVESRVIGTVVGPRVTRFELQLAPGIKVGKVSGLKDDLAYALATTEIRILAPIPGKSAVGVEVPNQRPDFVTLGDIYRDFPAEAGPLMVWLGKDISGKAVYTDLTKMPHLLIAGTTGSGKSGCINALISSVLLRSSPSVLRMVLIDPKKVELSHYDHVPHLLVPVVTNMKNAAGVLHNLVGEMDNRYELMELSKARHLDELNRARTAAGEEPLPYILIVIDELADLMMVSPQEVEDYIIRIAQKARAVGIHLVVATQRPSADVITGMIKANIPSRIAFAVSSQTDSRVILDVNGAESLLGLGDMLFRPLGSSRLQRIQGAYVTEEEIQILVTHWRRQAEPSFREELLQTPEEAMAENPLFDPDSDELLPDAASLVIETGNASVSMLQRRLRVGYTRAGRLIDMLERRGVVGPYEGSKPRQLLVERDEQDHVLETLRSESTRHGLQLELGDEEEAAPTSE